MARRRRGRRRGGTGQLRGWLRLRWAGCACCGGLWCLGGRGVVVSCAVDAREYLRGMFGERGRGGGGFGGFVIDSWGGLIGLVAGWWEGRGEAMMTYEYMVLSSCGR